MSATTLGSKVSQRFEQLVSGHDVVVRLFARALMRFSLVEDRRFFDPGDFPWTAVLEANWGPIRAELDSLLQLREELPNLQDLWPEQRRLTTDDRWKTYFFFGYGVKAQRNCARLPHTTRVLESIPGLMTAFFSVLGPHKHLPEHRGQLKGVLRYHLALRVPEPATASGITVGGETAHWAEGKCLVFDDTFPHYAWNDTDEDRVVLFIDVLRPLRAPVSWLNRALITVVGRAPMLRKAWENYDAWEREFDRRWAAAGAGTPGAGGAPRGPEGGR